MNKKASGLAAVVLAILGLVLILAGPVFQFLPTTVGIFGVLTCWVVAGLVKGLGKKSSADSAEAAEEEGEEEGEEE